MPPSFQSATRSRRQHVGNVSAATRRFAPRPASGHVAVIKPSDSAPSIRPLRRGNMRMTDIAAATPHGTSPSRGPRLDSRPTPVTMLVFVLLLGAGLGYGLFGLIQDIHSVNEPIAIGVFALLGLAL